MIIRDDQKQPVHASPHTLAGSLRTDAPVKAELSRIVPRLRAFARSLSGNHDLADDLFQDMMMKAGAARARYGADSNFRAWPFTILRNPYFSLTQRSALRLHMLPMSLAAWCGMTLSRQGHGS